MKKILILVIISSILVSCKNGNQNWSKTYVDTFVKNCVRTATNG
ncbi:MAG TPA: hypothetical protein PLU37_08040 [Chitinophagaceae bacterium]|nr:hypothetical protein [Chitinophagaceae bacterium]